MDDIIINLIGEYKEKGNVDKINHIFYEALKESRYKIVEYIVDTNGENIIIPYNGINPYSILFYRIEN